MPNKKLSTSRQQSQQNLLSIPQAAQLMGYSRVEIFRKVKRKEIPAQRIGRNYYILRDDLGEIYARLNPKSKQQVDDVVQKTLKEYGETIDLLGKE